MVHHKEFENAGSKPGLQVWRVEKMDLAPVPRELHGEFYSGDSYVLLYTGPGFSYNVHSWLGIGFRFSADTIKQTYYRKYICFIFICCTTGKDACQNERGSAAIFMTQLDDFLGGAPRQFTEFQDEESDAFMSLFKSGVNYKVKYYIYIN